MKYSPFFSLRLQLISDAIRYGDRHKTTMELADFWLTEKQLVHKLFKVLAPRFADCNVSYTRMHKAPREYPGMYYKRAVLELRGNPYPPLVPDTSSNRNLLHNVLLDEARKAYRKEKYAEVAAKLGEPLITAVEAEAASSAAKSVDVEQSKA